MGWLAGLLGGVQTLGQQYVQYKQAKDAAKASAKAKALEFRREQLKLQLAIAQANAGNVPQSALTAGLSGTSLSPWVILAAAGLGVVLLLRK